MIKQIEINNYGPFKNELIILDNCDEPIHIIGMNDVGKTALLNSIISGKYGLNKKYLQSDSEVKITYRVSHSDFPYDLINRMEKFGFKPFEGLFFIEQNQTEQNKNIAIFQSNEKLTNYIKDIVNKINKQINFSGLSIIHDKIQHFEIKKLIEDIAKKLSVPLPNNNNSFSFARNSNIDKKNNIEHEHSEEFQTATKLLNIFNEIKDVFFNIAHEYVEFLPADSPGVFNYIKSSYVLKKSTDRNGKMVESEISFLKNFLKPFLKDDSDFEELFEGIIFSDYSEEDKTAKKKKYEKQISKKITDFFKENFPSQNNEIEFEIDISTKDNKLHLLVSDKTSEDFMSLENRSDGFKWFLKLYILIETVKDGSVVVIDEPEKFLHAYAQKELVRLLKETIIKRRIQLIYATHSPFMLTTEIFPSLKIIEKHNKTSKIYNDLNSYVRSKDQLVKAKEVLTPLSVAIGISIFDLQKIKNIESFLLVEGDADLYTIKLSAWISEEIQDIHKNKLIVPMLGANNFYCPEIIKMHGFNFKIFLDNFKDITNQKSEQFSEQIFYLSDILKLPEIKTPEDIISETLKINSNLFENEEGHKVLWKKLYDDVRSGKIKFTVQEEDLLKKYWKGIKKKLCVE